MTAALRALPSIAAAIETRVDALDWPRLTGDLDTEDDYNCLHGDLYGDQVFPLQLTLLLSRPQRDFTGGEFVLTEQRPRMQSRPEVVTRGQGDAVIFAVHHRPVQGTRGTFRVNLRHGVSRVRSGSRHTLGVIFHDAR